MFPRALPDSPCSEHHALMDLGAQLNWPEIFYFPENSPGLQLTMVREGQQAWYEYVRGRGRDAVHTVLDRAQYEQRRRERAERYESNQQKGENYERHIELQTV